MKYFKSFLLQDSEEGDKVLAEVLARIIERQGKYDQVLTPIEVIASELRLQGSSSLPQCICSCSTAFGRNK